MKYKLFLCAVFVVSIIIAIAISIPFFAYIDISPKGGSTESDPVTISAGQDISIKKFYTRGGNYFTWDDGQKLAFDRGFTFATITTHAPQDPGIHKLTVMKDEFFFTISFNYYYWIE